MLKNRWNEDQFSDCQTLLDQRVYSSRLLGQESTLVLHGGGNTSVKDTRPDLLGNPEKVLYIKGSGWNLGTIEPQGFTCLRLAPLLPIRQLKALDDIEMTNLLRTHMTQADCPSPSVETLLHAFLPEKFIDHTHSDAILTLSNQKNGETTLKSLYGDRVDFVPYYRPGLVLSQKCVEAYERSPQAEGLILLNHGILTFGETAKESYDRMISLVQQAEEYIQKRKRPQVAVEFSSPSAVDCQKWMAAIRRTLLKKNFRCILTLDHSDESLAFVNRNDLEKLSQKGPATPDHVTRTKSLPMVATDIDQLEVSLQQYIDAYDQYFERNCREFKVKKQKLDPFPRVVLIPKIGRISIGATLKEAKIAEDIYRNTIPIITEAENLADYEALSESHLFEMEYWSLQQEKLKLSPQRLPLTGKIALVTGGASGIGLAITEEFLKKGAIVFVLDIDDKNYIQKKETLNNCLKGGNTVHCLKTDVSDRPQVKRAVEKMVQQYGGIDIAVINAGVFPRSNQIEDIDEDDWNRSLKVNLNGAFHVVAETLRWMKPQQAGGDILFVASKNVTAPGKQAGAYSVAKAAQAQLARVCALEAGAHGIRVNMVHPHLIFDTGIWTDEVIQKRAKAYSMTVDQYKRNNLLKTDLCSQDVANAAVALVEGKFMKTTGAQIAIDGGSDRTL